MDEEKTFRKRPSWIRAKITRDPRHDRIKALALRMGVNSVCIEAACPNRGECWGRGNMTFLILGRTCTRRCRFCNVSKGTPQAPDDTEPSRIAAFVKSTGAGYVVITSVTRDDLEDLGTGHFERTVRAVREEAPHARIELLIPDMAGRPDLVKKMAFSGASVIGHNVEMPESLYGKVRPGSSYRDSVRTLSLLASAKRSGADILVKSSIMAGLGENADDICLTMRELAGAGVDIFFAGQYLRPSPAHFPVKKFYAPGEFALLRDKALRAGFRHVEAGPMVRSSYRAEQAYRACLGQERPVPEGA